MATKYFTGEADAVAQVWTGVIVDVDSPPSGSNYAVVIGGVSVSVAGDTDVNTTATALRAALNASTHPYFAAITWSGSGGNIVGTGDVAGVPFVATLTDENSPGGLVTDFTVTTACRSPYHWDSPDNWSDGSVPVAGDDVIIEGLSTPILWGLEQAAVTLGSLTIRKTYTGKIGLDRRVFATTANGETTNSAKPEYREHYLTIGYDTCDIGQHIGPGTPGGSQRIKIDNAKSGASTTTVHGTAVAASETGYPAVRLLAAHADADIFVRGAPAGVGIAMDEPGEVSTVGEVACSAGALYLGPGVTLTTLTLAGGSCTLQAAATVPTVTVDAGTLTTEGDYTITTLNADGGVLYLNHVKTSGNAITTLNLNGGRVDGRQSLEPRTWATVNPDLGTLLVDDSVVTITTMDAPAGNRQMTVT